MSLVFSREVGFRDKNGLHPHAGLSTFSEHHARRLVVDEVLEGHDGCVNRLAWNEHGTRLASGSDDCRIILWRYPSGGLAPLGVRTEHSANIFGVEFLPGTDDRMLVSGAMDGTVQLHQLDGLHPPRPPAAPPAESGSPSRWQPPADSDSRIPFVQPHTTVYRCHSDRVKDVAVQAGDPHLFWSASEDGTVRQYDRRIRGQGEPSSSNALLWLSERSTRSVSCKSINICQAQPHLLALACGDPYVRVFDRRRLGPVTMANARAQSQPLLKLCPPHLLPGLAGADGRFAPRCHTTCASFSSRGDKVVATYYADHAYVYDITGAGGLHAPLPAPGRHLCSHPHRPASGHHLGGEEEEEEEAGPQRPEYELCRRIRRLSMQLDTVAEGEHKEGSMQQLLMGRAQLLMERGWRGDAAWAVRDLEACLEVAPDHCEARRLLVEALSACGQTACAAEVAEDWLERLPGADGAPQVREQLHRLQALIRRRQDPSSSRRGSDPEADAEAKREGEGAEQDDGWWQACAMDSWWPFYHRARAPAPEPAGPSSSSPSSSTRGGSPHSQCPPSPRPSGAAAAPAARGGPLARGSVWRDTAGGRRVVGRLVGQQNLHTDIKEAAFLGPADALVATGSDDGYVYLYCAESGEPLVALKADEDVANCCKPHPHHPVLATSGIENVVRLWAPGVARQAGEGAVVGRALERLVVLNQQSLQDGGAGHGFGAVLQQHSDLVRVVLRSLAAAGPARRGGEDTGEEEDEEVEVEYPCRVS